MVRHKTVKNLITGEIFYDTLHAKAESKPMSCTRDTCSGSSMDLFLKDEEKGISKADMIRRGKAFITDFYKDTGKPEATASRWQAILKEIEETGYYKLTSEELSHGAKYAWRNAPRCPGRIQWKNLTLFDNRHVETLEEVFQACCHHIVFSTNGGNIKPAITVFRERIPGAKDKFRVWNKQLLAFAGYEQADGSILGDPAYVEFTQFCEKLGWKPKRGRFDILPLVLSAEDHCPKFFEIPENIIKRVKIEHPEYPAIGELGLEWFGLPAVSGMCTEIGGVQFPAAPFSGWYSLPEVATRNLMDKQRYNLAEEFGRALNLDTSSTTNLWRDKVNTEINVAVLDSYVRAGVTIVDHHTQADQFMEHFKQEYETRGGCPADWVWIVPPESGSLTTVFHQEMLNYHLTPAYDYQTDLASVYRFPGQEKVKSFKSIARAVFFCKSLFRTVLSKRAKALVFYGTETGTSRRYADHLFKFLNTKYDAKISDISACSVELLKKSRDSHMVFMIASTFGNGDAPTTAKDFAAELKKTVAGSAGRRELENLKFAVLALGSTAYPNFCNFGKFLDQSLAILGGKKLVDVGLCDDQNKPENSFKNWITNVQTSLGFSKTDIPAQEPLAALSSKALDMFNGKEPITSKLVYRHFEGQRVIMVRLKTNPEKNRGQNWRVQVGDHIAVYPQNSKENVLRLIETVAFKSTRGSKINHISMRTALKRLSSEFDISAAPSMDVINRLAEYSKNTEEKMKLEELGTNEEKYAAWRDTQSKGFLGLLKENPHTDLNMADLFDILDFIKPRWYSLASAPTVKTLDTVDLVLSIVEYEKPAGTVRKGLCSNYLKEAKIGSTVTCVHRPIHTLVKPLAEGKPVVMIAAGSGIAPFRAVWQHLKAKGADRSKNILFFGCRNQAENLFYAESESAVRRITAFSRDNKSRKKYVQDVVEENGDLVNDLIWEQGGAILVCGSISMSEGVKKALLRTMKRYRETPEAEAERILEDLKLSNRYVEEIFGGYS